MVSIARRNLIPRSAFSPFIPSKLTLMGLLMSVIWAWPELLSVVIGELPDIENLEDECS